MRHCSQKVEIQIQSSGYPLKLKGQFTKNTRTIVKVAKLHFVTSACLQLFNGLLFTARVEQGRTIQKNKVNIGYLFLIM